MLDRCEIAGKDITGDALLTQRKLATYIVDRCAHYHFSVKGNQSTLEKAIALLFDKCSDTADFVEVSPPDHGRIETRSIWCSTALNEYLDFPHVGQTFLIKRECINKKTDKYSSEIALGITSRPPEQASPQRLLTVNRGHWCIESMHYVIDWNYHEDRCRIRTGFGPENVTCLRRLAISVLRSFQQSNQTIAEMMRKLCFRSRMVFDYLRMTTNSVPVAKRAA